MVADTFDEVIAGRPASFSWRAMLNGRPPDAERAPALHRDPAGARLHARSRRARSRPTRSARRRRIWTSPETTARNCGSPGRSRSPTRNTRPCRRAPSSTPPRTILVVLTILWLALRSGRLILAVFISLLVGLSITAALGLAMVGALNLISVAFAVLFIGLGVDFGIQFSVRYRAERHEVDDLHESLLNTASYVGAPLTLAAAATAAGFLSFLPTDYKGLSELGLLAGLGMIIAFVTSVTVIPALLTMLQPAGRAGGDGIQGAGAGRPVHGAAARSRSSSEPGSWSRPGCRCSIGCSSTSTRSTCRSPKVESVATFLELRSDPAIGANSIYVLTPNREAADADMEKLSKLPEVSQRQDHRELHSRRPAAQARRHPPARRPCSTRCCGRTPTRSRRPTPTTSPRSRPRSTACGSRPARRPGAAPPPPSGSPTISPSSPRATRRCASARTTP